MTITRSYKAVFGIQLSFDRIWRYILSGDDVLTLDFYGLSSSIKLLTKQLTAEDVDEKDKIVNVELSEQETAIFPCGMIKMIGTIDGIVCVPTKFICVKEV